MKHKSYFTLNISLLFFISTKLQFMDNTEVLSSLSHNAVYINSNEEIPQYSNHRNHKYREILNQA